MDLILFVIFCVFMILCFMFVTISKDERIDLLKDENQKLREQLFASECKVDDFSTCPFRRSKDDCYCLKYNCYCCKHKRDNNSL